MTPELTPIGLARASSRKFGRTVRKLPYGRGEITGLIDLVAQGYQGATAIRWNKFAVSAPLKLLVNLPLYQTEAVHFLAVLDHKKAGVSTRWLVNTPKVSGVLVYSPDGR